VPLHSSPAGRRYGRAGGTLNVTDDASARLIRLPLWADLSEAQADYVCETLLKTLGDAGG
jgi:dTDP-4-amino-4,6-dideoxygalactose transaminase